MNLEQLGWDAQFARQFAAYKNSGLTPARVAAQHRDLYRVFTTEGEMVASITGRLRQFSSDSDLPVVGDWVCVVARPNERRATIHHVLERRTKLARRAPGRDLHEQVLTANLDHVLIVTALDHDFSIPRIERYITLGREGGVTPVVVLNKADTCPEAARHSADVQGACRDVNVHALSALANSGLECLDLYLRPGLTVAMVGSSGVGKSTLLNALLGVEVQRTSDVRSNDSKGRHTTTHRQMFILPSGAMLVDTPGLREVQLWCGSDSLTQSFSDIFALAALCRFHDCRHDSEPGCAILAAVAGGALDEARFESFRKQQSEISYLERQTDVFAAQQHKRYMKSIMRAQKKFYELKE